MFGLWCGFEEVDLHWFVGEDDSVWINENIVWFKWMLVESLWEFVYDVIDKI